MKLKLRSRYALVFAAFTVLVVAAVKIGDLLESLRYQRDVDVSTAQAMSAGMLGEVEMLGVGLASMMASSLLEPVFEDDFDEIANITRAAFELAYVRRVRVYDHKALVIHDGTEEIYAYGQPAPAAMRDVVIGQGKVFVERHPDAIEICHPIKVGHRVLGSVALTIGLDQPLRDIAQLQRELDVINDEATRRQVRDAAFLAIAMALVGVFIGVMIAVRLSRPIDQLTGIAAAIAQGRYRFELPFRRSDELGTLARGLQTMARELEESTVSSAQLEMEVAERTAQLRTVNQQLKLLDRSRRQFFAEISHELKTPLTVIRGEAEVMLRKGNAPVDEFRHCLARIAEQTRQIGRLVGDLVDLAQAEAENFRVESEDVDLTSVVLSGCDDAGILARPRNVTVEPHVAVESLIVRGDPQRLRQLCLVLLDNAIRHSDAGSTVHVTCGEEHGQATLAVSDCGAGMSQQELQRAFERFERGTVSERRSSAGIGLGLPIARTIASTHGGSIAVDSRPGAGTRVTVQLPLRAGNEHHAATRRSVLDEALPN